MTTLHSQRVTRYSKLFGLVLSLLLVKISHAHARGFFCPTDEAVIFFSFLLCMLFGIINNNLVNVLIVTVLSTFEPVVKRKRRRFQRDRGKDNRWPTLHRYPYQIAF